MRLLHKHFFLNSQNMYSKGTNVLILIKGNDKCF